MSFRIEAIRSEQVESVHRVSVAVVDESGRRVASAGQSDLCTFWRSAAKPFQALPMVQDGAAARFGFASRELALACASHSSEPMHREVCRGMLERLGLSESALACGPHPPLSPVVAAQLAKEGASPTSMWSNCSGKHAGMLALALHRGWPVAGYERQGHPLQERVLAEVSRWTGVPPKDIGLGVDGCTAVCFALPLAAMATAYARFGVSDEPAAAKLREAMWTHPELVAGTGRLCTDLMTAARGRVLAKVGAEGIYCAALPERRLGVALKVEDGDGRCSP
ncbi:MAG: asparaginase, partial [Myxococcota bacterium]